MRPAPTATNDAQSSQPHTAAAPPFWSYSLLQSWCSTPSILICPGISATPPPSSTCLEGIAPTASPIPPSDSRRSTGGAPYQWRWLFGLASSPILSRVTLPQPTARQRCWSTSCRPPRFSDLFFAHLCKLTPAGSKAETDSWPSRGRPASRQGKTARFSTYGATRKTMQFVTICCSCVRAIRPARWLPSSLSYSRCQEDGRSATRAPVRLRPYDFPSGDYTTWTQD